MLLRTYIHRYVHTKVLRLLRFNPIKGRSLMAHIRRIREKIEADPSHPVSLITVKGLGYKLVMEGK